MSVRTYVTLGVASSVANDVIMRTGAASTASAVGARRHNENDVTITSGYAMVVHGRPKTLKNTSFWGHPAPRGRTAPIF